MNKESCVICGEEAKFFSNIPSRNARCIECFIKERKRIFLICSVRDATDEEKKVQQEYVQKLEDTGHKVYWPPRDTNQDDPIGLRICQDNRKVIYFADEVHILWSEKSQGSLFDFGMAFAMAKKIVLANVDVVKPTDGKKSFNNVLLALNKNK